MCIHVVSLASVCIRCSCCCSWRVLRVCRVGLIRRGQVLDLRGEKTNEAVLQDAVSAAALTQTGESTGVQDFTAVHHLHLAEAAERTGVAASAPYLAPRYGRHHTLRPP